MKKRSVIIIIILGSILCLSLAPLASVITPIVLIIFGSLIVYKLDRILEELKNNYDAIFFSIGSNIPKKIRIEGEDLPNVLGANELLQKSNYPEFSNKNVVVVGGRKCCNGCSKNNKKIRSK